MKVLVINSGSSSIKFELFEMPEERVVAKGLLQRIGESESHLGLKNDSGKFEVARPIADHGEGLALILEALTDTERGGMESLDEIGAVGHRVVHGGEAFANTVLIDDAVVAAIEDHVALAPLHNPPNLTGIRVAREALPGVPQVGVFDTAFHQSIPAQAYLYALPYEMYEEHRVRRYGFHGTSHRYVTLRAAELLGKPADEVNLITCHLGNGASVAAIANGRSIDTSMGLTPLEGLVMGTRSGDIDPAIPFFLVKTTGKSLEDVDKLLNKQSGVLGLFGKSNDLRDVEDAAEAGDERAQLVLDLYSYRIKKYVGAYAAALGRVDALIFTAGVGENSPVIRSKVCADMQLMGIQLDEAKNDGLKRTEADVTGAESKVRVLIITTNEELMIARDTHEIAKG